MKEEQKQIAADIGRILIGAAFIGTIVFLAMKFGK